MKLRSNKTSLAFTIEDEDAIQMNVSYVLEDNAVVRVEAGENKYHYPPIKPNVQLVPNMAYNLYSKLTLLDKITEDELLKMGFEKDETEDD